MSGSAKNKQLNTFDLFSLGVGGAIGSGIFVMMGLGIAQTGRSIVLSVVAGVLIMLFAYMYNLVESSMFVLKGGDYSQKKLLMGPLMSGVGGVFQVLGSMALSMYALAIVGYIGSIFPVILPYTKVIAVGVITLFFAATIRGSKFVALLQNIMTVVLLLSIALFIVVGLPQVQSGYFAAENFFQNGIGGFFGAVAIMGFACQGTTMGPVSVAYQTKDAKKTVPKAIFLVCLCVGLVYGLMSIVASGVLPYEAIAGQDLSVVAHAIFPDWGFVIFILGGAVFAIATSLMSGIAMMRFPLEQVADDGWLPSFFKQKTAGGYPWAIQLTVYIINILPIVFGFSLDSIVSLTMIPMMLMCAYCNFACIKLPDQYPTQWKESIFNKVPKAVFTVMMILSVACDLMVAYNLFVMMPASQMILVVAMLLFCVAVAWVRLKTKAVDVATLELEKQAIIAEATASYGDAVAV